MDNKAFAILSFCFLSVAGCYSEGDTRGQDTPQEECPAGGSKCYAEGAQCGGNVCHCGTWLAVDNPAQAKECKPGDQPDSTCVLGAACKGEGKTCKNADDDELECHCGRWMPPSLVDVFDCASSDPGGGGSGGSGGSSGSSGGGGSDEYPNTVEIGIISNSYHVWCEGAEVELYAVGSDSEIQWFEAWHSFGCDAFGTDDFRASYYCAVPVHADVSLRFQCYMSESGTHEVGNNVRYVFAMPSQLQPGEGVGIWLNGKSVEPILMPNLDPSGLGFNAQLSM